MKKFMAPVLLLSWIALAAAPARAASVALDDLLSRMESAEQTVNDTSFSFVQETVFGKTQESQHFEGSMTYKRPNSFIISYSQPIEQQMISDGSTIWIYTPQFKQVIKDSLSNWQQKGFVPKGLLSFSETVKSMREAYNVRLIRTTPDGAWLEFIPKDKQAKGVALKLHVSTEDYLPRETIFSSGEFISTTKIYAMVLNKGVDDATFRFKAPKGVSVESLQ